jgi:hypothetical protein
MGIKDRNTATAAGRHEEQDCCIHSPISCYNYANRRGYSRFPPSCTPNQFNYKDYRISNSHPQPIRSSQSLLVATGWPAGGRRDPLDEIGEGVGVIRPGLQLHEVGPVRDQYGLEACRPIFRGMQWGCAEKKKRRKLPKMHMTR